MVESLIGRNVREMSTAEVIEALKGEEIKAHQSALQLIQEIDPQIIVDAKSYITATIQARNVGTASAWSQAKAEQSKILKKYEERSDDSCERLKEEGRFELFRIAQARLSKLYELGESLSF